MKPNQERIEALFEAARQLASPAERAVYLDEACGEDPDMRREIEAMLEAEAAADQYFRTAEAPGEAVREAALLHTPTASADPLAEGPGTIIGRYKLLQQIGEGGFGVVYMAEQREPVVRKVALKIIKLGMDTKQVVARFEAERQALALMDHPHIAKVLDAGITSEISDLKSQISKGRPYFVMELVHGIPITAYCDKNNLSPAERLGLFLPVCRAIQHAHQKGIIHRDIKPSNVLVTLNDGVPHPMVIDFGVAKALNQRLTEKTLFTEFGQMIGTPAYMSPEQAEMSKLDVDTRSDVYSLGVLLYELLTGTTPFPAQRLRRAGWAEMQRIITEEEPPRPSTRLSALTEAERTGIAQHRQTEARKLTFLVRGELDWIVMKAMEKDRTRRYETANGLAMDIQRYLNDEPVLAVAPSARYRMMKFARRHRAGLAVTAALFGLLVAGVIVSSWQMVRARQAEQGAVAARGQAEAVSEFLVEAFLSADPDSDGRGRAVTVVEVLDTAVKEIEGRFKDVPERRAALLQALGNTYLGLGLGDKGMGLITECVELRQRVQGAEHPDTIAALRDLARTYAAQGRGLEAERLTRKTLETSRRVLGTTNGVTLVLMNNLAFLYVNQHRLREAEQLYRETLAINRAVFGAENPNTLNSMISLGVVYGDEGRTDDAEKIFLETLQTARRKLRPDHVVTLNAMVNLAVTYTRKGRLDEAEQLYQEALEAYRRIKGPRHSSTRTVIRHLAGLSEKQGRRDRRIALMLEHLKLAPANPDSYTYVLEPIASVTSSAERIRHLARFADVCAEVFASQTAATSDVEKGLRYVAACGATAAAAPQPEAGASLESTEQARLRALALGWLRADLALWTGRLDTNAPMKALTIEEALTRWQRATELDSIRDPQALSALPEQEREAFRQLWTEVAALHDAARRLREQSVILLAQGSRWAYWDDRSNPGTTWLEPGFDDAAWKRGPSPLGYGDPGMATTVSSGPDNTNRIITTYFRSTFTIEPPEQYARLALRLRRDDGVAIYLNGREVLRDNLPTEVSLAPDTVALKQIKGEAEVTCVVHELAPDSLRPGTNTVAVEVHQSDRTSSDLVFDLEIFALRKK